MNRNRKIALVAMGLMAIFAIAFMNAAPVAPEVTTASAQQIRSNVDTLPAEPRINMQVIYPKQPNDPALSQEVQNNFRSAQFKQTCKQLGVKTLMYRSDTPDYVHRYSQKVPAPIFGDPAVYMTDANGKYYKLFIGEDAAQAVTPAGVRNVSLQYERLFPRNPDCPKCPLKPKPEPKPDDTDAPAPEPLPATPLPSDELGPLPEGTDPVYAILSLIGGAVVGWAIMFKRGM